MILRIGTVQNKLKPWTLWNASGHGYEKFFNNKFIHISEDYIYSLIVFKHKSYWPYDNLNNSKWDHVVLQPKLNIVEKHGIQKENTS